VGLVGFSGLSGFRCGERHCIVRQNHSAFFEIAWIKFDFVNFGGKKKVGTDSRVELTLPDPNEEKIQSLCKKLDLRCVGWMFTDLVTEDGQVKHFRGNANSFYLSAEECITAAYFQNIFKNYTKLSYDGFFGSKFVTVVVTGNCFFLSKFIPNLI
jgi:hypothetical protein